MSRSSLRDLIASNIRRSANDLTMLMRVNPAASFRFCVSDMCTSNHGSTNICVMTATP